MWWGWGTCCCSNWETRFMAVWLPSIFTAADISCNCSLSNSGGFCLGIFLFYSESLTHLLFQVTSSCVSSLKSPLIPLFPPVPNYPLVLLKSASPCVLCLSVSFCCAPKPLRPCHSLSIVFIVVFFCVYSLPQEEWFLVCSLFQRSSDSQFCL